MPSDSSGVRGLETELIKDQTGGAITVKFTKMTTEELRQRCWAFPEARAEYLKRFLGAQSSS